MAVLVVAAISARVLAEQARDDGFEVIALDLFGDVDTRRACVRWMSIGQPGSLRIDADTLLAALHALAQRGDVLGWVAGSGFDGRPDLLQLGDALLPLIGTAPEAVRRIRDPVEFFGVLAAEGIAHPAVRRTAPADHIGWLVKDASGCGGWHIRHAAAVHEGGSPAVGSEGLYFQREAAGQPMSATFIANGRDARVLGFNRLIVRRVGLRPFVFGGVIGPLPLPMAVASRLERAVCSIVASFGVCGLGSLDFLLDGEAFEVLEVNPRPPASMKREGGRAWPCDRGAGR